MDKRIIEVKNVSVKYITGDLRNIGLKEYLMKKLTRQYEIKSFMAVNDVSFTVEQGDMLGIVGNNGAGKSTLLKVVTKIMQPSAGTVKVNGRIARCWNWQAVLMETLILRKTHISAEQCSAIRVNLWIKNIPKYLRFPSFRNLNSALLSNFQAE